MNAVTLTQNRDVCVVADDTDILVLLLHHFKSDNNTIFMKTSSRLINIALMQKELQPQLKEQLLFLHALTGCDTTSKPYGIGKITAMAKCNLLQSRQEIEKAGHDAMAALYGCLDLNLGRAESSERKS